MDGVAAIKQEFLQQRTEKVWNKDKLDATEKPDEEDQNGEANVKDEDIPESQDQNGAEQETKSWKRKKKEKGQNKKRPRTVPLEKINDRLCPNLSKSDDPCGNLDSCKFSHNVEEYMKKKPADIGDECVHFRLKGKCNFGLECRFANCHITENLKNLVDQERYESLLKNPAVVTNVLSKDLQIKLRKKQYSFPKTSEYLKDMNNGENANISPVNDKYEQIIDMVMGSSDIIRPTTREKKNLDFAEKLFLAPLTTVGNLPFRRICKTYGADITCGEMAMVTNLLQGQQSEWALMKRHHTEDIFGIQVCGSFPDTMSRCAEMLNQEADMDFIDVNIGCPIDLVFRKGGGCALMSRLKKFEQIVKGMVQVSEVPITVKMRTGIYEKHWTAHDVIPKVRDWGASLVTLHGRSREQRYTRTADWDYIQKCAAVASPMPLFGNGDVLSFEDANERREATGVSGIMIARGALIKPWIFTEIKEQRHWDISSNERFDILKEYVNYGLEHWGSDQKGVENTRRFLLEWLSFLHRYIPVGVLEVLPQKINQRPAPYFGRNDLETLMASSNCFDWVKISEMLLGPVPSNFTFLPKHKANSYS